MQRRASTDWKREAISIYEVHPGSWKRKGKTGKDYLSYEDLMNDLIPYVRQAGFTHVQLMPLCEHPFDGSWGYQPVGLFAPTWRFGDVDGLKRFVDACHQADIGVLLDWVPAHFPADVHGLGQFDGTALYEHEDPRQGYHPDWNTLIYNYGRGEVKSFLLSSAMYWLQEFHLDGLRLDAVSSMLHLDYSRQPGQWIPNHKGGRENLEAVSFLQDLNTRLKRALPGIMMIAEESTTWDGVTRPVKGGGLGFDFKWNMGWMNDTLTYLGTDPLYRCYHHNKMTFAMAYSHSENFILALSHDEVVHGKGSMVSRMPGDEWQKLATLRAYYGMQWGHPGKKHLFMGMEFGQYREWCHDRGLDWHLLDSAAHQKLLDYIKDLNRLYRNHHCLWEQDYDPEGFRWLDPDNAKDSVYSFIRYGESIRYGKPLEDHLVFVVNMTPQVHRGFRIGLPSLSHYQEQLNSDSDYYGGSDVGNGEGIDAESIPYQGCRFSGLITVPPLACVVFKPVAELP